MSMEHDDILARWSARLTEELGLAGLEVDIAGILKLAGVAAHSVVRPAAPLTTFIVGYAAGLAVAEGRFDPAAAAAASSATALALAHAEAASEDDVGSVPSGSPRSGSGADAANRPAT